MNGHRKRLREKFLRSPSSLYDYEILELLLCMARPRVDTKAIAKLLLTHFGDLTSVMNASSENLAAIPGLGEVGICALKLIHEASSRFLRPSQDAILLNSSAKVLEYCYVSMSHQEHEQFRILYLNSKNRLIKDELQQYGTIDAVPLYCREIMKTAMNIGATGLIMAHNHPSGDPTPSRADIRCTYEIFQAASALRISLHDHLIVAKNTHFSFRANKILGRAPPTE